MRKQLTNFLITIAFLIIGVFSLTNQVRAETQVSGNITSGATWTLADSPYIITSIVQVFDGVTLNIEPGVIIKFNKGARIKIGGKLIAIGTKNQNIIFTSNQGNPNPGDWEEILFLETSNESAIKNSLIEYSVYGLNIHSSISVSDNIIRFSQLWGINASEYGSPNIVNNIITGNSTGVEIGDKTILINNTIINNDTGVVARWGSPTISKNLIKNNRAYGISAQTSNAIIHNNNIYSNGNVDFRLTISSNMDITNNYWGTSDEAKIDQAINDYYESITLGKATYSPYIIAEIESAGSDMPIPTLVLVCNSFVYSAWSTCLPNGTKTRSVVSSRPNGCSGGNSILTQGCTYNPPICTSWIYSEWSSCSSGGQQTRSIISYSPNGCTGGSPVLTQSCSYVASACSSWIYSNWGTCTNGQQTRIITSSQPTNCAGGNPVLTQSCVTQSSICVSWAYSDWSNCTNGRQTRNIISSSPDNCMGGNPAISQSCQGEVKLEEKNNNTNSSNAGSESQKVIAEEKRLITKIDNNLSKRMSGNILLQVEKKGEGWYVNPDNKKKYYLGRPADAFSIMRNLGLGIKHSELAGYLSIKFPSRLSGKIVLDVEKNGEAYYVNPIDLKGYFLNRPADAFKVMRELGLGITNIDIRKIDVGVVN